MRRILVPLDGTPLAASILPDAQRLAGPDGVLILVRETTNWWENPEATDYMQAQAELLREEGVKFEVAPLEPLEVAVALDEAASTLGADMIACATHGRGPLGRLLKGGVAWRMVAHSSVPVLLRHPEADGLRFAEYLQRRILVPLDGSEYSEKAIPLAMQLAGEWNASVWLARVVPELNHGDTPEGPKHVLGYDLHSEIQTATAYLDEIARSLPGEVHSHALLGGVVQSLADGISRWSITDIVMASHGRTGLSRVILGSVADVLVQRLNIPIIVVPSIAADRLNATSHLGADAVRSQAVGSSV